MSKKAKIILLFALIFLGLISFIFKDKNFQYVSVEDATFVAHEGANFKFSFVPKRPIVTGFYIFVSRTFKSEELNDNSTIIMTVVEANSGKNLATKAFNISEFPALGYKRIILDDQIDGFRGKKIEINFDSSEVKKDNSFEILLDDTNLTNKNERPRLIYQISPQGLLGEFQDSMNRNTGFALFYYIGLSLLVVFMLILFFI